jgi:hypothetical protein
VRSSRRSERDVAKSAHQPPASRALSWPQGLRRSGQLATATGSSLLRSPRYVSQEEEHKPLQGRVAERAIAHQMARTGASVNDGAESVAGNRIGLSAHGYLRSQLRVSIR